MKHDKRRSHNLGPMVGIMLGLGALTFLFVPSIASNRATPTPPQILGDNLIYFRADAGAVVQKSLDDLKNPLAGGDNDVVVAAAHASGPCAISDLHAAPQGKWVAVDINCESGGAVQVVDFASGQTSDAISRISTDSMFVNWAPGGDIIVKVDLVTDPRLYRVNLDTGEAVELPVPWTTYDVAFSPDGKRMIYSLTAGLGYGSETWLADSDGANAKQVLVDPLNIIAFAHWSPAGDAIAYIRMADINVPFTVGELWTMDGGGQQPILLDKQADAGHGYALAWSPDGQSIAFVARENGEDILADQQADRLLSNIYVAKPDDGTVVNVTLFREALVENPVWSPDGQFLTFSARIGESADIWAVDMNTQQLRQVTNGADARFPVWVKADQQGRQP